MDFTVSRDGTTLVTLHEGTETTACDAATAELTAHLESLETEGRIADWAIEDAEVYEHPSAPFDPYTITVAFTVTVTVEADDPTTAAAVGADAIDEALENADVDAVSYTSAPAATAA